MGLVQSVEQQLEQAAAGGPGPWRAEVIEAGVQITVEASAMENLACALTQFEVRNAAWSGRPIERVKQIADDLAKRLTYLLEPIRPIETDPEHCIVQMRSNPPRIDEHGSSYYELLVERTGSLTLCRFEKEPGEVRRRVPIQITREVFRHLLSDFANVR